MRIIIAFFLLAFLAGCAPTAATRTVDGERESAPSLPKVLTIGIRAEPALMNSSYGAPGGGANGVSAVLDILNNYLMVQVESYAWEPQLAVEGISSDRGTWRLNADGTMDTIWRIHPNIRWHDGQPFTADDLVFAFEVYKDPALPTTIGIPMSLMESAVARDPQTLAIHWSQPFVQADRAPGLIPMPRHLLEQPYRTDKANFVNSPHLQSEFVGLGPYRLVRWEPGSYLELGRHDGYFLGRPPLDTVIIRILTDTQSMATHLLAGGIDVAMAMDIDTAVGIRDRWQETGNIFIGHPSEKMRVLELQFRPEFARPTNGLTNLQVRQALYHAIDRATLADVATSGLSPVADSWYQPTHELRPQLEAAIPQFPYDPRRAQALLAQAGWARGPDGILLYEPTGERFEVQVAGENNALTDRESNIIADHWKAVAVQAQAWPMSGALRADREVRAKLSGVGWSSVDGDIYYIDYLHTKNVAVPGNGWFGNNRLGYSNPRVDALLDRLSVTISQAEQIPLHRELLREQMGGIATMPLYWKIDPILVVKDLTGVTGRRASNIFEWNKR